MKPRVPVLLALIALGFLAARTAVAEVAKAELEGTWDLVNVQRNGRPIRPKKDTTLVVTGNKFVVKVGENVVAAGTIKLDSSTKPKTADFSYAEGTDKDQTFKGIYAIEGDTVRFARASTADGERPSDIDTKTGGLSSVYKRAKP